MVNNSCFAPRLHVIEHPFTQDRKASAEGVREALRGFA